MKTKSDFLDDDGVFDGEKAYGAILGTFLICSFVEIVLAFVKPQVSLTLLQPVRAFLFFFLAFYLACRVAFVFRLLLGPFMQTPSIIPWCQHNNPPESRPPLIRVIISSEKGVQIP